MGVACVAGASRGRGWGNWEKQREGGWRRKSALPLPPPCLSFSAISPTPPSAPATHASADGALVASAGSVGRSDLLP